MARFFKKNEENKGLTPGSLVFIEKKMDSIRIRVIDYDRSELHEAQLENISGCLEFKDTDTVTWMNINGLHDSILMQEIGDIFDLHPLLLEDIMNTGQRPKLQEYENCLFLVLKMLRYGEEDHEIISEQLSLVLGGTYVLTFQEQPGDVFEPVRERIRKQKGRIRGTGTDYFSYALLDTVVENYRSIIERFGEKIEDLEEEVLTNPTPVTMESINTFKREMNYLRKSIRPLREVVAQMLKSDSGLIKATTLPFIKDLQDLVTQASEAIDTYREMLSDQLNIYNSSMSNKMNEIMKVLTIFAAIFIPLTFIAGIYGTNFDYLPELHFKYSYYILWGVMILVAVSLLIFFKRKKWL